MGRVARPPAAVAQLPGGPGVYRFRDAGGRVLYIGRAVFALRRVFPLAYTADGLRGSQRDMARVRGADPADREALIASVTAVLERDRAARASLCHELTQRRERAAHGLAYELAARLQA